jgi:hypothetical protein
MKALRYGCGALALTAGLLLTGQVTAEPLQVKPRAAQAGGNAQTVKALRETIALLEMANHDYKGHRVKAIHYIRQAIHDLVPPKKAKPGATKPGAAATTTTKPANGGNNEDQRVSDAQLKQAIQQLQTIQSSLANGQGTTGNRPAAATAIGNAIQELQTALKIN